MSKPQPNVSASLRHLRHEIFLYVAALVGSPQAANGIVGRALGRICDVIRRKPTALIGVLLGQDPRGTVETHVRRITARMAHGWCQAVRHQSSNRDVHLPGAGKGRVNTGARRDSRETKKDRASRRLEELRESMCRRAISMRVEAPDDVVQIAWAKMLNTIRRNPASFLAFAFQADPNSAIEAYAVTTTSNAVRMWWLQTRLRRSKLDDLFQQLMEEPVQASEAQRLWDSEEARILVCRGLLSLCPQDRALIKWFYFENKSLDEIRQCLGLKSVGTVSVRKHRARGALATAIRAQQCLSCLDRQVVRMFVFERRSLDHIRCALKFLSTETLRAPSHTWRSSGGSHELPGLS